MVLLHSYNSNQRTTFDIYCTDESRVLKNIRFKHHSLSFVESTKQFRLSTHPSLRLLYSVREGDSFYVSDKYGKVSYRAPLVGSKQRWS